jgi:hypothetical protein
VLELSFNGENLMTTPTEQIQQLKDLLKRPLDQAAWSGLQNLLVTAATTAVNFAVNPGMVQDKLVSAISNYMLAKTYYECITLIRSRLLQWDNNLEVVRRVKAAKFNEFQLQMSLIQLIQQGGMSLKMELDLLAKQQAAAMKAQLDADKALERLFEKGSLHIDRRNLDVVLNFWENVISTTILKKLIEVTLNDVPDVYDTIGNLDANKQQRVASLRTLYQASGRSIAVIEEYYKNLKEHIRSQPDDTAFQQAFIAPAMPFFGLATPVGGIGWGASPP